MTNPAADTIFFDLVAMSLRNQRQLAYQGPSWIACEVVTHLRLYTRVGSAARLHNHAHCTIDCGE